MIERIHLRNFKNYEEAKLTFAKRLNIFVGPNGAGKTNLLDAVYYMCIGKSYFQHLDSAVMRHDESFFTLDTTIKVADQQHRIQCKNAKGRKKELIKDGLVYERIADHIGLMSVVIVTPDDNVLIRGGSEDRRKLLNQSISQIDRKYLHNLMAYNHALQQRNALLKSVSYRDPIDQSLLKVYNNQLVQYGQPIYESRAEFIEKMKPVFQRYYKQISLEREEVSCDYKSHLSERSLDYLLDESFDKDRILQRTNVGIHKDNLVFKLEGKALKKFGSQGQQKSYLLAVKLALYDLLIKDEKRPYLLLDDIFDKLDEERLNQLITLISGSQFGQVFITDTQKSRIEPLIKKTGVEYRIFEINQGMIKLDEQ